MYIYEAKMSLFLRLALSKDGSKLLVDNRVVDVLSHCQFINARPEQNLLLNGMYTFSYFFLILSIWYVYVYISIIY